MFKHLKNLATLLVLTQLFVLTFPVQSIYGLDTIDTATSFYGSGKSKYYLKDYRGAIQDYNKAIELDSDHDGAFYWRGRAKISLGQKDGGCLDLSKAEELGSFSAYYTIIELCN